MTEPYFIWRCPECGAQVQEDPSNNQWTEAGHYHEDLAASQDRWVKAERVEVVVPDEALTDEMVKRARSAYHEALTEKDLRLPGPMIRALLAAGPWARKRERCESILYVGPGHQSKRQCEGEKGHVTPDNGELHYATTYEYEWEDGQEYSGVEL